MTERTWWPGRFELFSLRALRVERGPRFECERGDEQFARFASGSILTTRRSAEAPSR